MGIFKDICTEMRALSKTCGGSKCPQFLAMEKGYQVLQLHEVRHFPKTSDELFADHINTFLKIKQEASGYPKGVTTEEQKQRYIEEYFEREGVQLDPDKIDYNPGLRALAKLMLNSF